MHIMDGVLSFPVIATGFAVAGGVCAWSAYRVKDEEIPRIAVFTAAFYVASLIHFPLPGTSVHLTLTGLMGVVLGRRAFLAVLIGLFLQFALLGPGGGSVLGVNACIFGLPALICWKLYEHTCSWRDRLCSLSAGFCGALGVFLAGILFALVMWLSSENLRHVAWFAFVAHIPIMLVEAAVTSLIVNFLRRVQPSMVSGGAL